MPDSDALERLKNKNRNRPVVSNRDASLASIPAIPDIEVSRSLETQVSDSVGTSISNTQEIQPLQTKQGTMRLEVGVSDRLQTLCRKNGIFREVLIEAMFEYCEANPEALQVVLDEAKKKNEYRQTIANQKRAKSMMERFGQR
jgi:hypothetical protein